MLWQLVLVLACASASAAPEIKLSRERMVFQTDHGDIHMAFYPEVAPITVAHMIRLGDMGLYTSVDFFRVDAGFVAQTSDVAGGRLVPMNAEQKAEAERTVPLEVRPDVKHDRRGILSMARHNDPNSGASSFSILLGPAPHLDMQYTVFGEVTSGLAALASMEKVETRKEGIFVMPTKRITILAQYMYTVADGGNVGCLEALRTLQSRFDALQLQLHEERQKNLPGTRRLE